MVTAIPTALAGVVLIDVAVFEDDRGFFLESWNQRDFNDLVGAEVTFVQDNHSQSHRGVLRGLHYQLPPHAQGKLVRCTAGRIHDVVVDIRRDSPTFGAWWGTELSADNHRQLWIPPGFAHGFVSLVDGSELQYKTTAHHAPDSERSITWDDPAIGIDWPIDTPPRLSPKDADAPRLADAEVFATDRHVHVDPSA